jgi:glycosyltransferase involved in cell wall biosynthesis
MTLLVLYEELAGYFLSCIRVLAREYHISVHIIHKEVNPEAPFVFEEIPGVRFYRREDYSEQALTELAIKLKPDAILCGGWKHSGYRKICKLHVKKIPVVLGFDNQWTGSLKQWAGVLSAPFYIHRCFNRCFVPGSLQKAFAMRLGFSEDAIRTGVYSCDQNFFAAVYTEGLPEKTPRFPHRFIYAGRYVPAKGIHLLWDAFSECLQETQTDWELWCLGTGPEAPVQHPRIRHCGFVQPEQLPVWMKQCGVFVLPSNFEPWGVALHEFVAAGFPVICSNRVGASELFLKPDANGFLFSSGNKEALKSCLKKIMQCSDSDLLEMGKKSNELSQQLSPHTWSATMNAMMKSPI